MASGPLPKLDESKVEREDVVIKGAGGQDMRLLVTRPKGKRENVPVVRASSARGEVDADARAQILAFHAGGFVLGFPEYVLLSGGRRSVRLILLADSTWICMHTGRLTASSWSAPTTGTQSPPCETMLALISI